MKSLSQNIRFKLPHDVEDPVSLLVPSSLSLSPLERTQPSLWLYARCWLPCLPRC